MCVVHLLGCCDDSQQPSLGRKVLERVRHIAMCSQGRISNYQCVEAKHGVIVDGWARDVTCRKCTRRVVVVLVMLDEYASQGTDSAEARERRNKKVGELDQNLLEAEMRERENEVQEPVRQNAGDGVDAEAGEGVLEDSAGVLEEGEIQEEDGDNRPWLEGIEDYADATSSEEEGAEAGAEADDEFSTATAKLEGGKAKGKVLSTLDILQDNLRKEAARELQRAGGLRYK